MVVQLLEDAEEPAEDCRRRRGSDCLLRRAVLLRSLGAEDH